MTQQPLFSADIGAYEPRFVETGDICQKRHKQNPRSVEANAKVNKSKDCEAVYAVIKERGRSWSKEIGRILDKPINVFSGRITWLRDNGYIIANGEIEEGCAVFVVTGKE